MDKNEIIETIQWHMDDGLILDIKREKINKNENAHGFPLIMSNIMDFIYDGYVVLRLKDINDGYSKETDILYEEMCIKEGLKERAITENPLKNIVNWEDVLNQLKDYKKYISVQCELEDSELCYSIGKISKIEDDVVYLNHFDLDGVWEKEPRKITRIDIDNNYCNTFYKYLKYPY